MSDFVVLAFLLGGFGPQSCPTKAFAAYLRLSVVEPEKTATVDLEWTLRDITRHDEE